MADYGFFIPAKGRKLIAGLLAGQKLEITKVMVGSGRVSSLEELAQLTDLVAPVAAATSTLPVRNGDEVNMVVQYRSDLNGGLETGFWLNEFGLYAMDEEEEVMIYYGNLGDFPQWVSAYNNGAVDIREYPVKLKVSPDVIVEITYPAMAFMTAEDVKAYCLAEILPLFLEEAQKLIDKHNADAEAHPAIQSEMDAIDARVALLELMYSTDVNGNPFTVTFGDLEGVTVEGVHNTVQKRIEF